MDYKHYDQDIGYLGNRVLHLCLVRYAIKSFHVVFVLFFIPYMLCHTFNAFVFAFFILSSSSSAFANIFPKRNEQHVGMLQKLWFSTVGMSLCFVWGVQAAFPLNDNAVFLWESSNPSLNLM